MSSPTAPTLPRASTALPPVRRWAGLAIASIALPLLTVTLSNLQSHLSLGAVLLLYLLVVVLTAAVGGVGPGEVAAGLRQAQHLGARERHAPARRLRPRAVR